MPRKPRRRLPPSAAEAVAGRTPTVQVGMEQFANRLHDLRTVKGWSQSELARQIWGEQTDKRTGRKSAKNRDRISCYEAGTSFPDPHNLSKLANALDVTPEALAPDLTGATVERQNPELALVSVAGHSDKVMLRINKLVPLGTATQIMALLVEGLGVISLHRTREKAGDALAPKPDQP
jgi:transcriptional regulator with XRE-family HTH domain